MADQLPIVTRAEFDQIACNRCGACCEWFGLPGPLELALALTDPDEDPRVISWLSDLEPLPEEPMRLPDGRLIYGYRCRRLSWDGQGLAVCTRYDERPPGCASFPHGAPVLSPRYQRCSYRVQIADEVEEVAG